MDHLEGGFWSAYRGCFQTLHDLETCSFNPMEANRYGKLDRGRWVVVAIFGKDRDLLKYPPNFNAVRYHMAKHTMFHTVVPINGPRRHFLLWYPDGFGGHLHAYEVLSNYAGTSPTPEEDIWL